jgi:class 3 adenylate cyclase
MRFSLRWKIKLASSGLLIILFGASLVFIDRQAERIVNDGITTGLTQAQVKIQIVEQERLSGLQLNAQVIASFPALKGALDTRDPLTVSDFLRQYKRREGDVLIVLDPAGSVLGRTDGLSGPIPEVSTRWVQPALANAVAVGHLVTRQGTFEAAVVPASANGIVFGFVMVAVPINDAYAAELKQKGNEDVVIAADRVLGSTLALADLPWQTQADWEGAMRAAGNLQTVQVGGESFTALPFFLHQAEEPRLLAVILQSRAKLLAPYRRIQFGLGILGIVIIGLGIAGSDILARSVAAKLAKLEAATERVARGDFVTPIDIRASDETEILKLGNSFNEMIAGLRERADMQKFISQTTVEMIRARGAGKMAAGDRVEMTLFFSDVRGFTLLSEQRPPEEVVRILNDCLSLQAGIVQKYGGDIDKYMGDCVMAHFYGPEGTAQAVQCAIEIEKAVHRLNAQIAAGDRMEVGIGVVLGEAILGSIGSENRRDFTAIGSNVNLCARLCSLAGPGEVLLSESAYQQVRQMVPAEKLEPVQVKGFSRPIPVYRIVVQARATA